MGGSTQIAAIVKLERGISIGLLSGLPASPLLDFS
jgi:hypothetical protein